MTCRPLPHHAAIFTAPDFEPAESAQEGDVASFVEPAAEAPDV